MHLLKKNYIKQWIRLRQALLLVNLLLFWFMNVDRGALFRWSHAALLPVHGGTLVDAHSFAVNSALNLTGGVQSCGVGVPLCKVSPLDVRDSAAISLDRWEVHLFLHDLAFLPSHWSASLSTSPDLVSTGINLPVSDAVVLGDLLALGNLLGVGSVVLHLLAVFEVVVLVFNLALLALDRSSLRCTFSPGDWLALKLSDISTNIFVFPDTSLMEGSVAALFAGSLVPDNIPEGNISAMILEGGTGLTCQADEGYS